MRRSRALVVVVALVLAVGTGVVATGGPDQHARMVELTKVGRYQLAADLFDDWETRGVALGDSTRWLRVKLETDPDRFDRQALDLATETSDPALTARITLARAREQFARGRYQTAAELLRPYTGPGADPGNGSVLLWLGMAEQAAGQPGAAVRSFRAIEPEMPVYATARALLADLALRAGRTEEAIEEAERSLDHDPSAGNLALSVLERARRERGETEQADEFARRLRDEYPESAEASWVTRDAPTADDDLPAGLTHDFDEGREGFALQFGAFRDRALALRLAERLEGEVEDLRIELERRDEAPLYRVVGGRYLTRAQAERAQRTLRDEGWTTLVLSPTRGGR